MNKLILIGRLTKDVTIKECKTEKEVATFTVACNRGTTVEFLDVVAFDHTAKYLGQYGKKGNAISLEAHLKNRCIEKDGKKVYILSIIADNVELFSGRKDKNVDDESMEEVEE